MRALIFLRNEQLVRDFLTTGAFDALERQGAAFVGEGDPSETIAARDGYAGSISPPSRERARDYVEVRELLLTSYRFKSRTVRVKLAQRSLLARTVVKLGAMPGRRQLRIAHLLRRTGLRAEVTEAIRRSAPDLVVTPSGGIHASEFDFLRSAHALGIPSLALMYNWDNLSSKSAFVTQPDYLGVVGSQSAEHARTIHGFPGERVEVLGSPYIDRHFRHEPGSTESPFPFRYVLFAGCYQPFDELAALERIDRAIDQHGLDLKVVYLPHPRRLPRRRLDFVDEQQLRNVVIEPRVRAGYLAAFGSDGKGPGLADRTLPVDAYPALLEHADHVVCPLSTMMVEAAIFGRRVLVIAYHDGLHETSPGVAIDYLHFEGVDDVELFTVCREEAALADAFLALARERTAPRPPPKEQMDRWIYHDERSFSERLEAFVARIEAERSSRPPVSAPPLRAAGG
jgi:hypothetical protein